MCLPPPPINVIFQIRIKIQTNKVKPLDLPIWYLHAIFVIFTAVPEFFK